VFKCVEGEWSVEERRSKEWESMFFMYERASLGRWLASKRDVRIVFEILAQFFWGGSKKRRRRVAGEESWSDEKREEGRRLVRQTMQLGRREGGHGPLSQI